MRKSRPLSFSKWWAVLALLGVLAYCLSSLNHALYVEKDLRETYQRAEFDKQILKLRARWFELEIENQYLREDLEIYKNKYPPKKPF